MKNKIIFFAHLALTSSVFAAEPNCSAIKADKVRLACYDKANKVGSSTTAAVAAPTPPAPAPAVPSKLKAEGEVFSSGKWHVVQKLDAMTDKKSCTALYQAAWTIQGTADTLYVSLRGRGGIKAYQLRVDDAPADELRLASKMEKDLGAADLDHSFGRVYSSKRIRLQVSTILGSLVTEDIDTNGFKESVDYIRSNCQA